MILQTGTIISVESDSLWVESQQKTACDSCAAAEGCGTRLLSHLMGKTKCMRVLLNHQPAETLAPGQTVTIAMAEDVVVKGSLLVYLLPVCFALLGAGLTDPNNDLTGILGFVAGLLCGGLIVRLRGKILRDDLAFNPVLFDIHSEKPMPD